MTHPIKQSGLTTMADLTSALHEEASDKLCVVMFTAGWCGPCKNIKKRIYDESSKKGMCVDLKDKAVFFYIDVDDNKELAEEFKITSIPHFFFMKCDGNDGVEMKCNFKGGSDLTEKKIRENC